MLKIQYASVVGLAFMFCATPGQLNAQESSKIAEEFRAQLAERDAIIIELQHAVANLRQRLAAIEKILQSGSPNDSFIPQPVESSSTPTAPLPEANSNRSDSTRLIVDRIAAERALERTLVQAGALLLPQGAVELTPTFSVGVSDLEFSTIVDTGSGAELGLASVDRTSYSLGLTARIGLPFDSQLELGIPYQSVTDESTLSVLSAPVSNAKQTGRGKGDFLVSISKTLLRESGYVPDIVGRLTWNTGNGTETDDGVFLGGGFPSLSGSLSLVKRRDPLALFLSLDYQDNNSQGDIAPGNAFSVSFGTGLAVSPESSLFGSITRKSISETKIAGEPVAGSDLDVTSLTIGFSTILSRGALLNLYSEIGMSDDAPDYALGFSVPMRMR